jgi:hypothetical protein
MFDSLISVMTRRAIRFSSGMCVPASWLAEPQATGSKPGGLDRGQAGMTSLIPLLVLFWSLSIGSAATGNVAISGSSVTYYAATNGSSSNDGLTTNNPWPLTYAMVNAGSSNTVIVLPGLYTWSRNVTISANYLTLKSYVKWGAVIANVTTYHPWYLASGVHGFTVDGLAFCTNQFSVYLGATDYSCSNNVARNCWFYGTGQGFASTSSASGIEAQLGANCLVEDCLSEWNGTNNIGYNHGIYAGGRNNVYRNNVLRNNGGAAISMNSHVANNDYGNMIYGNIMYGGLDTPLVISPDTLTAGTNYVFGNTIIETNPVIAYPVDVDRVFVYFTNNILIGSVSGGYGIMNHGTNVLYEDYNLGLNNIYYNGSSYQTGAHDIITNYFGFVNSAAGLYWLKSDSPARGKALSAAYTPVDFFGNAQSSVSDVGAFQYNAAYAADFRVLDPSPSNPDYWTNLAATNQGNASISVTPTNQSFSAIAVGSTADQSFTVQNIGSGPLSGSASVSEPFSIISGGSYVLAPGLSQVVTVRYGPTTSGSNSATVVFTGGTGTTVSVSGTATVPPPVVAAISQSAADIDPNSPGLQVYAGSVVQYSGSASDPSGLPLTWQWIYTVNGGPEVVLQSGAGTAAGVSFTYPANAIGDTYVWKLRVSNDSATAESDLTVGVEAPPPSSGTLTLQAPAGSLSPPFVVTNGYIYQPVSTDVTNGGQAVYNFTITNAGSYLIQTLVNAPTVSANSFYVNIDAEPQDPTMIWDVPITTGFEQRVVSWRGNGTDTNNQFLPKVFSLSVGTHQLVIVGRAFNTQLEQFSLKALPEPPQHFRALAGP